MRVACAWCKRDMGYKDPPEDDRTTHGMCPGCLVRQQAEVEAYFVLNPPEQEGVECGNAG